MADKLMKGPGSGPGVAGKPANPYDEEQKAQQQGQVDLREMAAKSHLASIGASKQGLSEMESANAAAPMVIRRQAAQGLAAAQGGVPGGGSGSALGNIMQSGRQAGLDEAQYNLGAASQMADARKAAAAQESEAYNAIKEMGTASDESRAQIVEADARINAEIQKYKSWYGDDEKGAAAALRQLASQYTDEAVIQHIMAQASKVQSGAWDF